MVFRELATLLRAPQMEKTAISQMGKSELFMMNPAESQGGPHPMALLVRA